MVKSRLSDGDTMFVVRIEHFVTLRVFTIALAEYYYMKDEDFPEKLSKKSAESILRERLFFEGIHGELSDGYFEATFEEGYKFNIIYDDALEWAIDNHPYLKTENRERQ